MAIEDLWYKNAVLYCLDVEKYMDADADGIGDFEGLNRRLEYLHGLGVTCLWLQPFYPSPNRDNGYDVADYYGVHPKHGSPGDFVEFMNHCHSLGMRVIVDLVVNHSSIDHPWFQSARASSKSLHRDWYVWADERPKNHQKGVVFPGVQRSTWTFDDAAGMWYFHRFYEHQADLNTHNPAVRAEIMKIMGYWLELGVSGFRMDAVPFLIERKGADMAKASEQDFRLLHDMRDFLAWRGRSAIMLAEANVPPEESLKYFGEYGDNLQMMLNFPVNQRLWYALATGETGPLVWALQHTAKRPADAQWVNFLRSHDECDLGRLSPEQRAQVFAALAPDKRMQLYDRGIRRRMAPMLGNDQRRIELAFSLLFSLPGTPMIQYGDEIGMGDNLELDERECARTPMQWTNEKHGGFSCAERTVRPVIDDAEYGYRKVNVADQRRDPESLLNWCERRIRMRKECIEFGYGDYTVLRTDTPEVLAIRYDFRGVSMLTLHNFSNRAKTIAVEPKVKGGNLLTDVFDENHSRTENGTHEIKMPPYGHRWMRVGAIDNALNRTPF
jgi:maltose alpha-D-glucosyltransferase / alpha-amylase